MISSYTIFAMSSLLALTTGTHVHVNRGCILIGGAVTCAPNSQIEDNGRVTIYAKFDGANKGDAYVRAGCKLDATWPANYGDIYYGADDCLYDSKGQNIGGQCCQAGTGGSEYVVNPYH